MRSHGTHGSWHVALDAQLAAVLTASVLLVTCAHGPPPRIMSEVDSVRTGAAAQAARQLAPQAFARAEQLRGQASDAYADDDMAGAQIISERTLAAYSHAFVLARLSQAQKRLAQANARLAKAEAELQALDEQQQRLAAEADDLQLRIRVLRDAVPLVPNEPAAPGRETARLEAARALASQARLLCAATRLLDPAAQGLDAQLTRLDVLAQSLSAGRSPAPIDEAIALRAACLRQLTIARRPATRKAPAAGRADQLLSQLSRVGSLFPFRDDRGVVVTLRGLFSPRGGLTKTASARLAELGRIAKAHADFPVLVVVHSARGRTLASDSDRAKEVARVLVEAGAPRVETHTAGHTQPVVRRTQRGARTRNTRVEIVFVSPSS